MRKILFILLLMTSGQSFGQISIENIYSYSGTYTKLSVSGTKFYLMDTGISQCRIYNTNHTLWKTVSLNVPANSYVYDIKYLSEHLFTTDNSLCLCYIYYYYDETNAYYTFSAKIIKEDGTSLISIPGCQYIELLDLESEGVKLLAYCYDYSVSPYTIQTRVYSLPNSPTATENPELPGSHKLPYPSPAIDFITIRYSLPNSLAEAEIAITDIQGKLIDKLVINSHTDRITLPTFKYQSGIYCYTVEAGKQRFESGKFIVK